ncbi:hypothetical protein [Agrobacterium pusense]|jgi:hypothetical protein|uniref:hypothetical protein n=1 Tax=Agrobacterium pusense TaxID=648995 RepID=UPI0037BF8726
MDYWWNVWFEAAKLLLQFCGALFIAWRAVKWAQLRYQREKHWERRLGAYSDVTTALGTLLNVLAEWEDQEITRRAPRGATGEEQLQSYWNARRKLEEAHSLAMLILPPFVAEKIKTLVQNLARNDDHDHVSFVDHIDDEWKLVLAARDDIVKIARDDLHLEYLNTFPKKLD